MLSRSVRAILLLTATLGTCSMAQDNLVKSPVGLVKSLSPKKDSFVELPARTHEDGHGEVPR